MDPEGQNPDDSSHQLRILKRRDTERTNRNKAPKASPALEILDEKTFRSSADALMELVKTDIKRITTPGTGSDVDIDVSEQGSGEYFESEEKAAIEARLKELSEPVAQLVAGILTGELDSTDVNWALANIRRDLKDAGEKDFQSSSVLDAHRSEQFESSQEAPDTLDADAREVVTKLEAILSLSEQYVQQKKD